jgi:hypothetical protein
VSCKRQHVWCHLVTKHHLQRPLHDKMTRVSNKYPVWCQWHFFFSLSFSFSYVKFSPYFVLFEKILKLICFLQFHPFIFLISYLIYILFIAIFLKFEKFTKIYFFFPVSSLNIKLIRNWASWFSSGIWFYVLCIWEINLGLRYFLGFAFFLFFFLSFFFPALSFNIYLIRYWAPLFCFFIYFQLDFPLISKMTRVLLTFNIELFDN